MIDKWQIQKLQEWLTIAKKQGTDRITVTQGARPGIWIVTIRQEWG